MLSLNVQEGGVHEDIILKPYSSCPRKHGHLCLCQNLSFLPLGNTVCISTKLNSCSFLCHRSKEGAGLYLSPPFRGQAASTTIQDAVGIITLSLGNHMNPFWVSITVIFRRFPLKFSIFVSTYLFIYIGQ